MRVFPREGLREDTGTRAQHLILEYADLPLGFVAATVVAIAERLGVRKVLTTDRRHFGVVRPKHAAALLLLP